MTFAQKLEREMQEREREHFAARREYHEWLVDNDCTLIVSTYWFERVMAASRRGRVTVPEND